MIRQVCINFVILLSLIYLLRCEKINVNVTKPGTSIQNMSPEDDIEPTLSDIKKEVQLDFGKRPKFTYELYDSLLDELGNDRYKVLPLNEFRQTTDSNKVLVGLRHDVDGNPFNAMDMAVLEENHGISCTYYILHSAWYYGRSTKKGYIRNQAMNPVYQTIFNLGHEIGIHNDLIEFIVTYNVDPVIFIQDEIEFYRQLGIPIWGTSAHSGKLVLQNNLNNYNVFSNYNQDLRFECQGKTYLYSGGFFDQDSLFICHNFQDTTSAEIINAALPQKPSLEDYAFEYEAYHISFNRYLTDSGGEWNKGRISDPLDYIRQSQKGDRLIVMTHPLWWGKKN